MTSTLKNCWRSEKNPNQREKKKKKEKVMT